MSTQVNMRSNPVRLLARHWQFYNDAEQLAGAVDKWSPGVVGESPVLPPSCGIQYSSWTQLPSSEGTMEGLLLLEQVQGNRGQQGGQEQGQEPGQEPGQLLNRRKPIEAEVGPVHLDSSIKL